LKKGGNLWNWGGRKGKGLVKVKTKGRKKKGRKGKEKEWGKIFFKRRKNGEKYLKLQSNFIS